MTRKIARQSEVTPLHTIDEYLWNQRLGITQLPPVDMSQEQSPTSSLPPQSSQAPAMDYDSSNAQSDMFGSGVSGEGQLIAPKVPNATPASNPARSKAASQNSPFDLAKHLMDEHAMNNNLIRDHDENVKLHDEEHYNFPTSLGHKHSSKVTAGSFSTSLDNCPGCGERIKDDTDTGYECHNGQRWCGTHHPESCPDHNFFDKTSAVSTLYGDVEPTPTTGESSGNGSQSNRNNSSDNLPNGPDSSSSKSPAAAGEEEGGAGLASGLGEAAELAVLASKRWVGSVLDPKEAKFKYIRHNSKTGKWEIFSKKTGKTLSTHDSESEAQSAFKAMEAHMHG